MTTHSHILQRTKADTRQRAALQNVMNLYGVLLFSGLLLSIFTHGIEDVSGFMSFLLISGMLYFLLVTFYFKGGVWRSFVYATTGVIGLISICTAFYLA
ncbi:hypothetical protein [Planococcus dechangensis]|uniref:DUF3649 domain-containing protein n=1 Tax=Planococcus dechangensis TaxID=1176255 RepID=A0ABV9MCB8_9BACL